MAIDLTANSNAAIPEIGFAGQPWPIQIDLSVVNRASGDVLSIWDIPANTVIKNVYVKVTTVEDSTSTIDIGDGVDPNGYVATANLETLGWVVGAGDLVDVYGKAYLTADTLDITFSAHATDTAIFEVWIEAFSMTHTAFNINVA